MTLPAASIGQYEALRKNALEPGQVFSAEPLGAILMVKSGMAGWMRQWSRLGESAMAAPSSAPLCPAVGEAGWQHELTVLLAEMTAAHLRPTGS